MHLRRLSSGLALAGVLALAGCGDGAQESDDPAVGSPSPEVQDEPTAPPEEIDATTDAGAEVPDGLDWVLDDLNGGQVVGADLAGRDVILWFWAPW